MHAAPVKNIDCLLEIPENLPIKTNIPFVVGYTNLANKEIPIIDLAQLLGLGQTKISKKSTLIVLRIKHSNNYLKVGIITDSTYEYKEVDAIEISENSTGNLTNKSEYSSAIITDKTLVFKVLDTSKVLKNINKYSLEYSSEQFINY